MPRKSSGERAAAKARVACCAASYAAPSLAGSWTRGAGAEENKREKKTEKKREKKRKRSGRERAGDLSRYGGEMLSKEESALRGVISRP